MQVAIVGGVSLSSPTGTAISSITSQGITSLAVTDGAPAAVTSLSAATTGTGTVADFGSACQSVTFQVVGSAGISAGAVQFLGSIDGVTFTVLGTPTLAGGGTAANPLTVAASTSYLMSYQGVAIRYFRCDVSTNFTGGTVTAKIMGY